MKRIFVTSLSTPVLAAALVGCATPTYPVTQGYVAPPPITPKYPASAPAAPAADPAPASPTPTASEQQPLTPASTAPTPATVESTALAPAAAPQNQTAPAPASEPAPSPAPPQTAPPPAAPAPRPYTPAPQASAPARTRVQSVHYLTDGKVVEARGMYRDYIVQKGDHLDAIARDLHTTRRELVAANRLGESYAIRPGRHLKVPVAKAYVTVAGDNLTGVAKRFGVSLGELSNLNDLPERGRLSAGVFIALPDNYEDHGPSRMTVTEEVYTSPRPRAVYRPAETASVPPPLPPAGGAYVPSQYALAAAAARRAQAGQQSMTYTAPDYAPGRPPETSLNQAALVSAGLGKFVWPVKGEIISSFGATGIGRRNDGVDIGSTAGNAVRAAAAGEVVYAGDQVPGFGNLVLIKHAAGWVSAYAHLGSVNVHMRDNVYQGQPVGTVGMTGGVSQPQLHFELRYAPNPSEKARPLDPLLILPKG